MSEDTPKEVSWLGCEGDYEQACKLIYEAMVGPSDEVKNLRFMVGSDKAYEMFLSFLVEYLDQRQAPKVKHVQLDIFIEQKH